MQTQGLAILPDRAALTIAGCVLVFMGAMLFVILSPYRIEAEAAGVLTIREAAPRCLGPLRTGGGTGLADALSPEGKKVRGNPATSHLSPPCNAHKRYGFN
jgi:hypothetical protein